MATQPDLNSNDGWIEWTGGECPVPAETLVEIRCRCGDQNGAWPAGFFAEGQSDWWRHDGEGFFGRMNDIIAYRLVSA